MFMHRTSNFSIYFGDSSQMISVDEINQQQVTPALINIAQQMQVRQCVFLHQNHGVQGFTIELDNDRDYFFQTQGDFLITQKKACGIGVVTADCLPIVIYDSMTHTISVIHAGWKGLVGEILQIAVQEIIKKMGASVENLEIYLGPSARSCCYEVKQDFIDQFKEYQPLDHIFFIKNDAQTYFDSRAFVIVIARSLGINAEKIYTMYNVCTICNLSFCSYRRDKEKAHRQITMIGLH